MKTLEELANEYVDNYFCISPDDCIQAFTDGYQKAHEWIPFDETTNLHEGTYLCMWEGADPEWTEIKVLSYQIDENGGYWINEVGDYDENITHFRYINL